MAFISLNGWPLQYVAILFIIAAIIIGYAGSRMTRIADRLADLTGLGEAIFGAVLLGGSTSLPGIVTSVWTASEGYAQLSVSNAIGGIAAQTVFLVIADITYRKVNLEHAAASVENLVQSALLMSLLSLPLLAMSGPEYTVFGVHPASMLLVAAYIFGLRLISHTRAAPLWKPHLTRETKTDKTKESSINKKGLIQLWTLFILLAITVGIAGFIVAQTGITIANRTDLSETLVGALLTSVATSLPELVTSVAAVRQGAVTLAVGGIIGGNSFDVLFIAFSDIAYREGSIYHAITSQQTFLIALTLLMTGIILLGLLRREKSGFANIGFESLIVIVLYVLAMAILVYT